MAESQTDHAAVKIGPPVLLLAHVFTMFLLNWLLPLPLVFPAVLEWMSYSLILIGLASAFSAVRCLLC